MNQMRGIDVLVLRNVVGMLDILLHAPRGPFYSPKAARSR
jgi:predicted NUDIX family NTP pyrophosphohydrolase